jgi:hypothetical protein
VNSTASAAVLAGALRSRNDEFLPDLDQARMGDAVQLGEDRYRRVELRRDVGERVASLNDVGGGCRRSLVGEATRASGVPARMQDNHGNGATARRRRDVDRVLLTTLNAVPATPPKVTPVNPVPVMTTAVPPAAGPVLTLSELIVGAEAGYALWLVSNTLVPGAPATQRKSPLLSDAIVESDGAAANQLENCPSGRFSRLMATIAELNRVAKFATAVVGPE